MPLICLHSSDTELFGASINLIHALATSFKLCGGISVAIPTAIPVVPFNKIFGSLAGNNFGSCRVPSKLGSHSTVPCSTSLSRTSA